MAFCHVNVQKMAVGLSQEEEVRAAKDLQPK